MLGLNLGQTCSGLVSAAFIPASLSGLTLGLMRAIQPLWEEY